MTHFLDTKGKIADKEAIIREAERAREEAHEKGDKASEKSFDNLAKNLTQEVDGLKKSI